MNEEVRLSVNDFNQLINRHLNSIGEFIIEGEITQMNVSSKGGVNIVLKDKEQSAIVNVSGYRPRIQGLNLVKEGMQVAVWGAPQIWSPAGRFSVSIHKVLPIGEGALKQAYETLKGKLELEGLFDESRKRPLPDYITKVALVTAKGSAAYSDFVKILQENKAGVEVDFYPVQVQGKYAIQELHGALQSIYDKEGYGCIVVTRGGGSLEDLIAFNDENLARLLFKSKIPTIVGVGHENDESIVDFVADLRASTPSQAAYYIANQNNSFVQGLYLTINLISQKILVSKAAYMSKVANKVSSLERFLLNSLSNIRLKLQTLNSNIKVLPNYVAILNDKLTFAKQLLTAHNPNNILNKGYAAILNEKGKSISSVKQIKLDDKISIKLVDGSFESRVIKV